MKPVAYDCETYPIHQCGKATNDTVPRLVCLTWADADAPEGVLLTRTDAIAWWIDQVRAGRLLVGANLPFDLNVMLRATQEERPDEYAEILGLVFKAAKFDVQVAARLEDIGRGGMFLRGGYKLSELEKRYLPEGVRTTEKKGVNVWRLRYNELEGVPADQYPEEAARYALEDAVNTWAVYGQVANTRNANGVGLRSQYDWELSLMSAWGLMVDQGWVGRLIEFYEAQRATAREFLTELGVFREDGTKNLVVVRGLFQDAFLSIGETAPLTPSGKFVATDKKALNALEDAGAMTPAFDAYQRFNRADKFIGTYLTPLADAGDLPLCPRFNVIVDSGRTSSSGPNVQNFPARANAHDKQILREMLEDYEELEDEVRMMRGIITGPDIRGSFVPRPGCAFVAADYSAIEMAGVAQCMANLTPGYQLGTLGLAINDGIDLHCYVGAQILGLDYEEFNGRYLDGDKQCKQIREVSKIGNYGGWGGAGPPAFRAFARQQGAQMDIHTAELVLHTMARVWTEREPYFRFIDSCQQSTGSYYVEQHGPDHITRGWRLRVTKKFTQAANTLFQGIVADGALWSMHLIMQDIYFNEASPLFGARLILFVHDEFVVEAPLAVAEEAGARLSELMVAGMKRFLPDLLVEAKPHVMEQRWAK